VHLARMIDKAQAFKQNQMADYIYPCPLDKIILNFLRIDSDAFAIKAMESGDDEISAWAEETLKDKKSEEFEFINDQILERQPDSEDRLKYFYAGLILQEQISTPGSTFWTWKKAAYHQNNLFQQFSLVYLLPDLTRLFPACC